MNCLLRIGASLVAVMVFGLLSVPITWGSSGELDCASVFETTKEPTDADDLCWLLRAFLESHHSCEFPPEYLDRITKGGKDEGPFKRSKDDRCLRKVVIKELQIDEISVIGNLTLKNKHKTLVSHLVYSGDKWLMYWPTRPARHIY